MAAASLGAGVRAAQGTQRTKSSDVRIAVMFPWPIYYSAFPLPKQYFVEGWPWTTQFLRQIALLADKLGFQGINLGNSWMLSSDAIRDALNSTNLVITSFGGPGSLQQPAGDKRARGLETTRNCIALAKALGCSKIDDHYLPYSDELDARDQPLIDTLKELAPDLEQAGIGLDLEPMYNPKATGPINLQAHTVKIIQAVGSPNIKVVSDLWHMSMQKNDLVESLSRYGNYTGVCHCSENGDKKTEPGSTGFDYRPAFKALKKWDYSGWLVHEANPSDGNLEASLARGIKYMRQQWSEA